MSKALVEFGPLVVFLVANAKGGYMWGTGLFMLATVAALVYSYWKTGHLAKVPLVSAVFVGIFGGLTIYFHDQSFIQVKVSLVNAMLGVVLLGGLWFKRSYLSYIIGNSVQMHDEGWRVLSFRWGVFFIFLAILNEVLRHMLSWDQWVWFKTIGLIGLTMIFALANMPLMAKHMKEDHRQGQPPAQD